MLDAKATLRARNPTLYSLLGKVKRSLTRTPDPNEAEHGILRHYVTGHPSDQTALDVVKGEWSSRFPSPFSHLRAGEIPLFEDPRVEWAISQFGDIRGRSVLELGPLEGGHSYMLERAGFSSVLAIEANTHAYLKCLITKEIVGLSRTHFLCGDFLKYLRSSPPIFDAVFACGVLYHMQNPVELIELLSAAAGQVFIWTHHYAPKDSHEAAAFSGHGTVEHKGFSCAVFRRDYGASLSRPGFCGGARAYMTWMRREDILACLKHFGFVDFQTAFDQPNHTNGPAFAVVAKRRAVRDWQAATNE